MSLVFLIHNLIKENMKENPTLVVLLHPKPVQVNIFYLCRISLASGQFAICLPA